MTVMRVLLFVLDVSMLREVRGMRGVGGVCEMHGFGWGRVGGEWIGGLGLKKKVVFSIISHRW